MSTRIYADSFMHNFTINSFSGNSNLIYTVIRKRNVFHQLANLATDHHSITKALSKRSNRKVPPHQAPAKETKDSSMEGSFPAHEAQPGTLKATLAATPGKKRISERSGTDLLICRLGIRQGQCVGLFFDNSFTIQ